MGKQIFVQLQSLSVSKLASRVLRYSVEVRSGQEEDSIVHLLTKEDRRENGCYTSKEKKRVFSQKSTFSSSHCKIGSGATLIRLKNVPSERNIHRKV